MSHHDESSWGDVILISFSLLDNTTSLDPKMNRSQRALQYLNQQGGDDSVIYKGLMQLFLQLLCKINHVT